MTLISKEETIEKILSEYPDAHYPQWYAAIIEKIKPIEKRGEGYWIGNYTPYKCSNPKCNHYVDSIVPYCPHCGNRNA